jgi:hypothetical protein
MQIDDRDDINNHNEEIQNKNNPFKENDLNLISI